MYGKGVAVGGHGLTRSSAVQLAARARQVLSLIVLALLVGCGAVGPAEDEQESVGIGRISAAVLVARSMPCGSNTIGYLEHLPSDYTTSGSLRYPTMIFLHGLGERGSGSPADLELLKRHGPPKHIQNGHTMTFTVDGKTERFIVIAPQLSSSSDSYSRSWLTCVINYTQANYRVDPDRLYITGLSLGGNGTYLAATSTTLAPSIAAIAPIAAWGPPGEACVIPDNHIAVWAFHGDADTTISLSQGQAMIDAINGCQPTPCPPPRFTIYPGVGHNSWDQAYDTGHTYHDPNLYEWLLRQRRGGGSCGGGGSGSSKLALTPLMVVQETGAGDARMLVDEQALAGDPRGGVAGQPTQAWISGERNDMPANAYLDLGEEVDLSDIYLFDTNGDDTTRDDEWVVSVGTPGSWTVVAMEPCDRYFVWKRHTVAVHTRYVRITNRVAYVRMSEVVLYGSRTSGATTRAVRVDLGGQTTTPAYNNLTGQAAARGGAIANLVDTTSQATGIALDVSGFNAVNPDGTQAPAPELGLPASATSDSFYGNTVLFNGIVAPEGHLLLSGLNPTRAYELRVFASRMNVGDNRETQYRIDGGSSRTLLLQVANNTSNRAVATEISPAANGTISIAVTPGPSNNNTNGFFYLGVFELLWSE